MLYLISIELNPEDIVKSTSSTEVMYWWILYARATISLAYRMDRLYHICMHILAIVVMSRDA